MSARVHRPRLLGDHFASVVLRTIIDNDDL